MNYLRKIPQALSNFLNCFCPIFYKKFHWDPKENLQINFENKDNEIDLHLKVKDCCFFSSHNTCQSELQILGVSNTELVKQALYLNCRCLEFDIFSDYDKETPVVAHGKVENNIQLTSSAPFKKCVEVLNEYAWRKSNFPLILFLQFETYNKITIDITMDLLKKVFGEKIFLLTIDEFKEKQLFELLDRVIIFTNKNIVVDGKKCINYNKDIQNVPSNIDLNKLDDTKIKRIYPKNFILSNNYNTVPFYKRGCNFISLNIDYMDAFLMDHIRLFNNCSIIPLNNFNLNI